jgi:hypothetical protein
MSLSFVPGDHSGALSTLLPCDVESNVVVTLLEALTRRDLITVGFAGGSAGSPSQFPANYAAASPLQLATSKSPPTLLFHGGRDELVSTFNPHLYTNMRCLASGVMTCGSYPSPCIQQSGAGRGPSSSCDSIETAASILARRI